jgi:hypothetical protein
VIGVILSLLAATPLSATPVAIATRQEIRNGKLYDVLLAPSCKSKKPICKPWQREWTDSIQMLPKDIVTPEGLILREVVDA